MKTYINTLASYKDAPIQKEIDLSGEEAYLERQIRALTRSYKKAVHVNDVKKGDIITVDLKSDNSKFNRQNLKLSVGSNLFDKELEEKLIGLEINQLKEVMIHDQKVEICVKDGTRTIYPTPTNEMVKEYCIKNEDLKDIETVEQFKEYYINQFKTEAEEKMINQNVENIINYVLTHTDFEFDEGEIQKICHEIFQDIDMELSQDGKSLETITKDEFMLTYGVETKEEFEKLIRNEAEWIIASSAFLYTIMGKDPRDYSMYDAVQEEGYHILEEYIKEQLD